MQSQQRAPTGSGLHRDEAYAATTGFGHVVDVRGKQDDGALLTKRHLGDCGVNRVLVAVQPRTDQLPLGRRRRGSAKRQREGHAVEMYICYIEDMSEPMIESMAEVRNHLADVIDRAHREETPTIITRRGRQEAVVIDIEEYQRLRQIADDAEEAWLNRLADESEAEGVQGSVSLEEMAALLRGGEG